MSICPSFHELCTNILTSKSKAALPSLVQKNSYTTVQVQSRTKIRLLYCTLKPLHLLRSRPTPAHFNLPANLPHGQVLPDSKSCHIKVLILLLRQVKLQARFRRVVWSTFEYFKFCARSPAIHVLLVFCRIKRYCNIKKETQHATEDGRALR